MPSQTQKTFGPVLRLLTIVGLSFFIGFQVSNLTEGSVINASQQNGQKNTSADKSDVNLGLFWEIWGLIDKGYYEENVVTEEQKIYGAIKGMVKSIDDPHTAFMDPEESRKFSSSLEGELEGIGAELTIVDDALTIVSPLRNSPAERAGLLPGDIIYKINGDYAIDMTLFQALTKIRGTKGTSVTLTIIREQLSEPFDVTITRDTLSLETVTVEKLPDGITYIIVSNFNDRTNEELNRAISDLILEDPKGLIVDLRFNGGGYLETAIDLLSYFLPADTPAVIIKARNNKNETLYTGRAPKLLNVPLVVLVNGGSASSSEIFTGAIQDHKRGIALGLQTFGKGSIQEVHHFTDGSSIRMTTAKWFTPNDRSFDKVGLTPDIIVEITEEDILNEHDSQKEAAINYLKNL